MELAGVMFLYFILEPLSVASAQDACSLKLLRLGAPNHFFELKSQFLRILFLQLKIVIEKSEVT